MKQTILFKTGRSDHGGDLRKKRKGRGKRPLSTQNSLHLVLRSTKAVGKWSFSQPRNRKAIVDLTKRFGHEYGVKVLSMANVGNHIHYHVKLSNLFTYKRFIKALTGMIVSHVTGCGRGKPLPEPFWDLRPFSRVTYGYRGYLVLKNYVRLNHYESMGLLREQAREVLKYGERWFEVADTG